LNVLAAPLISHSLPPLPLSALSTACASPIPSCPRAGSAHGCAPQHLQPASASRAPCVRGGAVGCHSTTLLPQGQQHREQQRLASSPTPSTLSATAAPLVQPAHTVAGASGSCSCIPHALRSARVCCAPLKAGSCGAWPLGFAQVTVH